jgi:hypothetical protein
MYWPTILSSAVVAAIVSAIGAILTTWMARASAREAHHMSAVNTHDMALLKDRLEGATRAASEQTLRSLILSSHYGRRSFDYLKKNVAIYKNDEELRQILFSIGAKQGTMNKDGKNVEAWSLPQEEAP